MATRCKIFAGRAKSPNSNAWRPIVYLLGLYEYNSENPRPGSPAKKVWGIIVLIIGIVCFFGGAISDSEMWPSLVRTAFIGLAMAAIMIGMALLFTALTSEQFSKVVKTSKKLAGQVEVTAQILFALGALLLSTFVALVYLDADSEVTAETTVQLVLLVAAVVVGNLIIGSGSIEIGIVAQRSRFNSRKWAAIIETVTMTFPLAVAVYLFSTVSVSWPALAFAILLALIGYCNYKLKNLDRSFVRLIECFDEVRRCSLEYLDSSKSPENITNLRALYGAYRRLHLMMISSPSVTRRSVTLFSIHALCVVADARSAGDLSFVRRLKGSKRISAAARCASMSDRKFAIASAQVFDGLLRMMDSSFAPTYSRKSGNRDLRDCLNEFALSI
ncbi:hypothetical protein [Brevibacterium aurantiacum]|uniref:hypothetical protein n=1 Tax=Brevibacterium aurantiacum TaxID=273384 RepID=UPI00186655F6|nr:hypothetical protein [Brevibacterium aurantiacum]